MKKRKYIILGIVTVLLVAVTVVLAYRMQQEKKKEADYDEYTGGNQERNYITYKGEKYKYNYDLRTVLFMGIFVLVEFSYHYDFQKIRNSVYELVSEGYNPILAHIERYACLNKHKEYIEELIQMGAYMQINTSAVLGKMGFSQKHFCKKVLQEHLIHFIASDAHSLQKRRPNMKECKKYVEKKVGVEYANEIFVRNPQLILEENRR